MEESQILSLLELWFFIFISVCMILLIISKSFIIYTERLHYLLFLVPFLQFKVVKLGNGAQVMIRVA